MSEELFDICLYNINKYVPHEVVFGFFGEQMLHPRFNDFISKLPENHKYRLKLNTNFSLATYRDLDSLHKFDEVKISLDSSDGEIWNKLCPGSAILKMDGSVGSDRYITMEEKVKEWLEIENHSKTRLIYVISHINKSGKDAFIEKWRPLLSKRDCIHFKSIISYGGIMKDVLMKKYKCRMLKKNRFTIGWNGDCTPCNIDVNIENKIGNLYDTTDLFEIYKSDKYKYVKKDIRKKRGICENCFDAGNPTKHEYIYGLR
jgi:radical SAM protein with 4Fe4S-binding SPASM domain